MSFSFIPYFWHHNLLYFYKKLLFILSLCLACSFVQKLFDHNCFAQSLNSNSPTKKFESTEDDQSETQDEIEDQQSNDGEIIVRESVVQSERVKLEHNNLKDLLKRQGVATLSMGGEGSRLEIQIRGGTGAQAGIYLDQIPLHGLRSRAIDLNLFALDLFQEVQLQAGGQGALEGSGAMSGSIRFVPQSLKVNESSSLLKLQASTQGYAQFSGLTQTQLNRNHSALFTIALGGGPNQYSYRNQYGANQRRQYSDFRRLAGLSQITSQWKSWKLISLFGAGDLERGEPGPETFSLPERRSHQYSRFISVSAYSPNYRLKHGVFYALLHSSFLDSFYGFHEAYPLWQSQSTAQNEFQDQRTLLKATLNYDRTHYQTALRIEFSDTQARLSNIDAQRFQAAFIPRVKYQLSPKLHLDLATRLDLNTERHSQIVPSATLLYQPAKFNAWRSWLKWSRVWRDPGFDERYLIGPSLVPNAELQPEFGQWLEWGTSKSLTYRFNGLRLKLKGSWALFYQDFEQLIHYVPIDPYRIRAENLAGARLYGSEKQVSALLFMKRFRVVSDTRINLLNHKLKSAPFTALPLRPRFMANSRLGLRTKVIDGFIELWSSIHYRGATTIDLFAERSLASRHIISIGLNRTWISQQTQMTSQRDQPATHYQFSIKLENIGDQNQYDFALQPIPGRSFWFALAKKL